MGKIDQILDAAVADVNKQQKVEEPVVETPVEKPVEKKAEKKEEKPSEQLELIEEENQEPKKEKKKFKVKSYGKEKEIELDDEELPEYVQRGAAATEKWKETVKIQKEIAEKEKWIKDWESTIKKNPDVYFEQLFGKDKAQQYYETKVLRAYEMEKMSPEQKEVYERSSRIAELKKEEEELAAKSQQRKDEEMELYAMQRLSDMTSSALKKVGIETPNPTVFRKYLDFIRPYLENAENVTEHEMDLLTTEWNKRDSKERSELFNGMDGKQLMEHIGKANVEKIRKELLTEAGAPPVEQKKTQQKDDPKKYKSVKEYINSL